MLNRLTSTLLSGTAPAPTPIRPGAPARGPLMQRGLPHFDGVFTRAVDALAAAGTDFGRTVRALPQGVLYPKHAGDIRRAVDYARRENIPITMRGQGHSAYGQAQVEGGIVIDSRSMTELRWAGRDCIIAGPGANWLDIAKLALTRGYTPPVIPDTSVCLTVGGTLSVGGWGETTHRYGGQVDNVVKLEVVTGTGEFKSCSPTENRDLFDAVRGGMGQVAIIVRAWLRMVPAPENVRTRTVPIASAEQFVSTLAAAAGEPNNAIVGTLTRTANGFQPSVTVNRFDGGESTDPVKTYWDYVDRATKTFLDSVKSGDILRPHPYMSFFVPERAAVGMVQRLMSEPELTLGAERVVVFPYEKKHFGAPFFALPEGERGFHVRIYRKPALGDTEGLKRMLAINARFMKDVYAAGGTVYLPHAPIPTREQLVQQYGPERLAALVKAKRRYDPDGILAPQALPLTQARR